MISARVLPVAHIHTVSRPPLLYISAADIALGYIDAPRALWLRVDSNSRAGFALDVSALGPGARRSPLQGFDAEVALDDSGGSVVQRWQECQLACPCTTRPIQACAQRTAGHLCLAATALRTADLVRRPSR